jgi:hypothetical protein
MINLLYLFLAIALFKLLVNFSRYIKCKHYLNKYLDWLIDHTSEMVGHKSQVIKLFQDAGVEDSYRVVVEPLGFRQIQTAKVSVWANFPNSEEYFAVLTTRMFHQAIGAYRSRVLETFNPLYWIEFVINLPRQALSYLGVSPESATIKIAQLAYWVVGAVFGFLFALYKPEIEKLVRDWIDKLVP